MEKEKECGRIHTKSAAPDRPHLLEWGECVSVAAVRVTAGFRDLKNSWNRLNFWRNRARPHTVAADQTADDQTSSKNHDEERDIMCHVNSLIVLDSCY